MQSQKIENTVIDEANGRTYVIVAPRVLTDGEMYRAIRQELLRRGGKPLAHGETLTLTVTSSGRSTSATPETETQKPQPSLSLPNDSEAEHFTSPPGVSG